MRTLLHIGLLCLCIVPLGAGCAARQPSQAQAAKIIQKHFTHYAKKFPATRYGQNPVQAAHIDHIEEVHKHYVLAMVQLTHRDGDTSQALCALQKEIPRGWRLVAWEQYDALPEVPSAPPGE